MISNSIKFSDKQPVINIWGETHDGMVSIYIEDNGIGIEEEGHQKIFHAFQKMHSKNEYEGSGLGLAICKRIVDIHHGHMSVSSVVGGGSTFIVELPTQLVAFLS
jgi:light-regulated signal transduction histidine kinase (bacteriophytochrome)